MNNEVANEQYSAMLELVKRMDPAAQSQVHACLADLQQVVEKYEAMSVIALALLSAKTIGEQHGKD